MIKLSDEWESGFATFTRCKRHRLDLGRIGAVRDNHKGICLFILNNPSTADSLIDDATVRRGWLYTVAWGYRTMVFANVNPFCSTDPDEAQVPSEDVLKQNDDKLKTWAQAASVVVAAWGTKAHVPLIERALHVVQKVADVSALELCKDGTPKHILYLKGDLKPIARYPKFPSQSRTSK